MVRVSFHVFRNTVTLGGPGQLGVLKRTSASRTHHLLKTFWTAWRDKQPPDGTGI
jgi:hypothetical protein